MDMTSVILAGNKLCLIKALPTNNRFMLASVAYHTNVWARTPPLFSPQLSKRHHSPHSSIYLPSLMGDPPRSPTPNFHSVLGIPKNASLADICRAYKTLVMKWHPDRNISNKAEAEAKIRAINEAYRTLSNKKREEEYQRGLDDDAKTQKNLSQHGQNNDFCISSPSTLSRSGSRKSHTAPPTPTSLSKGKSRRSSTRTKTDFFASYSSGNTTPKGSLPSSLSKMTSRRGSTPIIFSQSVVRTKPPPIEKKLECTLEELACGCVKKIKITRDVISNIGVIVQEEELLKIKVKPGWKRGTKITFEGKGDERPGTLPADIIFIIDEKRHPIFKRLGDDLELGVEIPLVQALTGCNITIPLLGGENMDLSLDDIIHPGYHKIIPGKGMPKSKEKGEKGDLQLNFLIEFPTDLSEEQRSDITHILQDCS